MGRASVPNVTLPDPDELAATPRSLGEPPPAIGMLKLPDGAVIRHACWEPPQLAHATLLMLNGRSEFIEKYDELARDWTARGYRVFSLDWRGQGLSTRPLPPPRQQRHYLTDFGVLEEDLQYFLERVVVPRQAGPLVMYAHSMGGHIAARYLATDRRRFAAAVLSAPMVDISTNGVPRPIVRVLAAIMTMIGFGTAYALGQRDYDPQKHSFATNPVTHDPKRWAVHHQWFRSHPELRVGGVTWAWLNATFRSVDLLARAETVAGVDLPLLVLSPEQDPLIPRDAHREFSLRYHNCDLIHYPDARHEVLMETDDLRSQAWADIDSFLEPIVGKAIKSNVDTSGSGILGDAAVST
jgi:lysophospholipase